MASSFSVNFKKKEIKKSIKTDFGLCVPTSMNEKSRAAKVNWPEEGCFWQ